MVLAMSEPARLGAITCAVKAMVSRASNFFLHGAIDVGTDTAKVFFGYPHRASTQSDMESNVARLLYAGKTSLTDVPQRIVHLAGSIIETNRTFLNTKLPIWVTLFNVYSTVDNAALRVSYLAA